MTFEATRRVPKPHHNFVPEYQMSGIPFVTTHVFPAAANAATLKANIENYKIEFPTVTRWILFNSHDDGEGKVGVRIYFNVDAAKTAYDGQQDEHYYLLDLEEQTERFELKCKYVYVVPMEVNKAAQVAIAAGLTSVPSEDFPDQTKLNGFLGVED